MNNSMMVALDMELSVGSYHHGDTEYSRLSGASPDYCPAWKGNWILSTFQSKVSGIS